MKDYLRRPQDLENAVQLLRRLGLSVSLPHQTAGGEMFFEIEGCVFTVAQILELLDKNGLDAEGIRRFAAKRRENPG